MEKTNNGIQYDLKYKKGDRRDFIKVSSNYYTGDCQNLINGVIANYGYLSEYNDNYFIFEFDKSVCLTGFKFYIEDVNGGRWKLYGSRDNNNFIDLNYEFDLVNENSVSFKNNKKFRYYKILQFTRGAIPKVREIEFDVVLDNTKFIIKQNNQYYSIKSSFDPIQKNNISISKMCEKYGAKGLENMYTFLFNRNIPLFKNKNNIYVSIKQINLYKVKNIININEDYILNFMCDKYKILDECTNPFELIFFKKS